MPRRPRILEVDDCYHVVTRGNNKKRIFRAPYDYIRFLAFARSARAKHPLLIYHYCLMPTHIHLLVRALATIDFSKFFQVLLQRYAYYFREKYHHMMNVNYNSPSTTIIIPHERQ